MDPRPHMRSRWAAICGGSIGTCCRSRTRAARSASRARPPGRTSPISCSAFRTPARSRSATPTRISARPPTTPTCIDDWRVNPVLTVNAGVRWEYESPVTERLGRLVNLDIAPGFGAASPVVATSPTGAVTGQHYPDSLMRPDVAGLQPRVGIALRPVAGSSLVIRAGYGIYRNTSVYQPIAIAAGAAAAALDDAERREQCRRIRSRSRTDSPPRRPARHRTHSPSIPTSASATRTTGRCSVQRDLPASLTVTATYLGTSGSHLLQEFAAEHRAARRREPLSGVSRRLRLSHLERPLDQEHRPAAAAPPSAQRPHRAPSSTRSSKATDDAGAFTGVRLDGSAIAQDWRDLGAEAARRTSISGTW